MIRALILFLSLVLCTQVAECVEIRPALVTHGYQETSSHTNNVEVTILDSSRRAFFRFCTADGVVGRTVNSATIRVKLTGDVQSSDGVFRLRSWTQNCLSLSGSSIFTCMGDGTNEGLPDTAAGSEGNWSEWDVTSLVQGWASGNAQHGFSLSYNSTRGRWSVGTAELVIDMSGCLGDSNNDGVFNSSDLVLVFQAGKYETSNPATWAQGDWNADGLFNTSDLVAAFQQGCYSPTGEMMEDWEEISE